MSGLADRLDSPAVRIGGALVLAAAVATVAYVLQSQDIQQCVEAGNSPSACSARHRDLGRALGLGGVMFLLTLTPSLLSGRVRDRLANVLERIPGFRSVHPETEQDRRHLRWAGRVGVPASVIFSISFVLWLAWRELGGPWATVAGLTAAVSGAALIGSFVYSLTIRRRIRTD